MTYVENSPGFTLSCIDNGSIFEHVVKINWIIDKVYNMYNVLFKS